MGGWLIGECVLGIGLFEEGRPELIVRGRVEEDEAAADGGQPVVDHHVHPSAILPESETKHTTHTINIFNKVVFQL